MLRKSKKLKNRKGQSKVPIFLIHYGPGTVLYLILSTQQPLTQCPFYQGKSTERLSNLFNVTQLSLCSAAIIKLLQLSLTSPNYSGLYRTNS